MAKKNTNKEKRSIDSLLSGELIERRDCIYEVDSKKAFQKLSKKQFHDPFFFVRELIANGLDAYKIKKDAVINLNFDNNVFSVTDYGIGMDNEKINALRTLGLSEKEGEDSIGRFGMGFASVFNPKIGAKKVVVNTFNGEHKELVFDVIEPGKYITLEEYVLDFKPDYSTRVSVVLDDDDTSYLEHVKRRIKIYSQDAATYLPVDIFLDGKPLPRLKNYGAGDFPSAVLVDKDGVEGFLALDSHCFNPGIKILSKNLKMATKEFKEISNSFYFLDDKFPIFGVLNYDKLNPVSSRNDVLNDERWRKVCEVVDLYAESFIVDFFNKYSKKRKLTLPERLNASEMVCQISGQNFINEFKESTDLKVLSEKKPLYEKIINLPVFQFWNDTSLYNLSHMRKILQSQGRLFHNSDEEVSVLLKNQKVKVLRSGFSESKEVSVKLANFFGWLFGSADISDLANRPDLKELLLKEGLVEESAFKSKFEYVPEDSLDKKTSQFLSELRKLISHPEVKSLLEKYQICSDIGIKAVKEERDFAVATYSPDLKNINLNLENQTMRSYLHLNPKDSIYVFLPIMAHEISHDKVLGHDNPFYTVKDVIARELRQIMSGIRVEQKMKEIHSIEKSKHETSISEAYLPRKSMYKKSKREFKLEISPYVK
jgi:hypothetical protein